MKLSQATSGKSRYDSLLRTAHSLQYLTAMHLEEIEKIQSELAAAKKEISELKDKKKMHATILNKAPTEVFPSKVRQYQCSVGHVPRNARATNVIRFDSGGYEKCRHLKRPSHAQYP